MNWAKSWFYNLGSKKEDCTDAVVVHGAQKEECDEAQGAFEQGFCSYRQTLVTKCAAYEKCRADAIEAREKTHAGVKIDEAARKAMHVSGEMVLCFLEVFEVEAKDAPAKLKEC